MAKAHDVLSRDEIREFTQTSDLRGAYELAITWAVIVGSFALAALVPHPLTAIAAVILLGGRQLGLAILMHDCSHYALFQTRGLNNHVGNWLCGAPIWTGLERYRRHHLKHHSHTGTERDPDMGLVAPFPTTRGGLVRKFLRDLTGVAGLRRGVGLFLMDAGILSYSASTGQERVEPHPGLVRILKNLVRYTGPTVVTNLLMFGVLAALGHAWVYSLWAIAWFTTYGAFLRLRAIAEHACTTQSDDMLRNTRTTLAGPIARLLIAPHYVNYHLEHHLVMTAPCYRLKALHRTLKERGAYENSHVEPSYWAMLGKVITR